MLLLLYLQLFEHFLSSECIEKMPVSWKFFIVRSLFSFRTTAVMIVFNIENWSNKFLWFVCLFSCSTCFCSLWVLDSFLWHVSYPNLLTLAVIHGVHVCIGWYSTDDLNKVCCTDVSSFRSIAIPCVPFFVCVISLSSLVCDAFICFDPVQ